MVYPVRGFIMKKRTMDMNIREPRITGVSLVARNILLLTVQEGAIVGGVQEPYRPQEGETLEQDKNIPSLVYIVKDGKRIGVKVEDRQKGVQRFPFEKVIGEPLDENAADDVLSYSINGRHPFAVWRKSKPNNVADPAPFSGYTKRHCLYLVLCEEVMSGTTLSLTFRKGLFDREEYTFSFVESECFSEAVQVSQIGYRSDDVGKKAYLSQWLGLGGGVDYDDVRTFYLLDGTGKRVFAGDVKLQHTGAIEPMGAQEISSLCPVYEMDFSAFRGEGVFRVLVPGIGCSFPFSLGEDTWLKGFYANMNGLYCQRSGIKTGAPYTEFERPRCYHPDDGQVVYQSKCSLFESGNGLNCYGTDVNNFENLVRKGTEERVENAWGGYFDACDWDRRIQHLKATRLMCELFLMFPDYFADLKLTIPESGNGIPDVLNEGLYNLDFYKRLQLADGGIRGGIEQEEHPILGQCGWQDAWKAYAYAPDFWSSYYYASAAARMAFALRPYSPERAEEYALSAQKAFDYAERTYTEGLKSEGHKWTRRAHQGVKMERENAVCDLFRLTCEERYEKIYLSVRDDKNYDACFVYGMLPNGIGQAEIKRRCKEAILSAADVAVKYGAVLPYHLTTEDRAAERAGGFSAFCTVPRIVQLIRAHYMTGEESYLAAAIAASGFGAGANPDNLCFTTGLGVRYPLNPLHHDSRMTGQEAPVGITVCGPHDFSHPDDSFPRMLRADFLWPGAYVWPSFESYLDIYREPCINEYTVQGTIGPNAYQWGYFAARKAGK